MVEQGYSLLRFHCESRSHTGKGASVRRFVWRSALGDAHLTVNELAGEVEMLVGSVERPIHYYAGVLIDAAELCRGLVLSGISQISEPTS